MVGLDVGILARVVAGQRDVPDKTFAVITADSTSIHQQISIFDGRDDDTENAYAHTCTLRMDIVAYISSLIEKVRIDFQLVQLFVGLPHLGVGQRGIGMGEYASDIAHIVVNGIICNAVTGLQALVDVVFHLPAHHAVGRPCHSGYHEQYAADGKENDDFSQTAVCKLLYGRLFLVGITVELLHSFLL